MMIGSACVHNVLPDRVRLVPCGVIGAHWSDFVPKNRPFSPLQYKYRLSTRCPYMGIRCVVVKNRLKKALLLSSSYLFDVF